MNDAGAVGTGHCALTTLSAALLGRVAVENADWPGICGPGPVVLSRRG
jgi:hypothetical protein